MKKEKKSGLDKTLIFIAILDTIFVIAMIVIFCLYQSTPDILIGAVFAATFGECGCCSYIWKIKKEKELKKEETNDGTNIKNDNGDNISYSNVSNITLSQEQN